jgi:hypothetical protein
MDEPFPILEHLSISSTAQGNLTLPETFLAPNLRHLTLSSIRLPGELSLLSTVSLVTLALTNIPSFRYLLPKRLVTHLQTLSQLEELSIGFSVPSPRPSAERELPDALETRVTLPALRRFTFRGVSAYLESLVAQMRAPLLEQLDISFFNQLAFTLSRLSDFTNATQGLKLPIAKVIFKHDAVAVVMHCTAWQLDNGPASFSLSIISKQFDWQIDSAAQICGSLMPALSSVEQLTLDFNGKIPAEWQGGAVDGTTWHELLGPFIRAKELHICRTLTWELSSALQLDDVGLDPGLLPSLQELAPEIEKEEAVNAFASFIDIRRVAGRPVGLSPLPSVEAGRPVGPLPLPSVEAGRLVGPSPLPFVQSDKLVKRSDLQLLVLSPAKQVEHSDRQLQHAEALYEGYRDMMNPDDRIMAQGLLY